MRLDIPSGPDGRPCSGTRTIHPPAHFQRRTRRACTLEAAAPGNLAPAAAAATMAGRTPDPQLLGTTMDDSQAAADPLKPKYHRVILKLSGEGFGYVGKSGISIDETLNIARVAKRVVERGVQLAI